DFIEWLRRAVRNATLPLHHVARSGEGGGSSLDLQPLRASLLPAEKARGDPRGPAVRREQRRARPGRAPSSAAPPHAASTSASVRPARRLSARRPQARRIPRVWGSAQARGGEGDPAPPPGEREELSPVEPMTAKLARGHPNALLPRCSLARRDGPARMPSERAQPPFWPLSRLHLVGPSGG